jgi:hypothetical protein
MHAVKVVGLLNFVIVQGSVMRLVRIIGCVGVFLFLSIAVVQSAVNWTGSSGQTNDWHTASNWGGTLPATNDAAYISNGGTALVSTDDVTVARIEIAQASTGSGELILSNRTVTISGLRLGLNGRPGIYEQYGTSSLLDLQNKNIIVGNGSASGGGCTFTLHGGVVTNVDKLYVGYAPGADGTAVFDGGTIAVGSLTYVGLGGTGRLYINGGTNIQGGSVYVGYDTGSTGTLVLAGGVMTNMNRLYVGNDSNSWGKVVVSNGVYSQRSGAWFRVGQSGTGIFEQYGGTVFPNCDVNIGYYSNSVGTLSVAGGTFSATGEIIKIGFSTASRGTMQVSGGTVSNKSIYCGMDGTGEYIQSGGTNSLSSHMMVARYSGSTGTVTLTGGKLIVADNNIYMGGDRWSGGAYGQTDMTISGDAEVEASHFYLPYVVSNAVNASLTIQGGDAGIQLAGNLYCNRGGQSHLKFVLEGRPATISAINCDDAYINANTVTIEWALGTNFLGSAGAEYTLIQANNAIATNNCNFVDSTTGGNFTINLSADGKRLYLKQTENYPRTGTVMSVR